MSKVKNKNRGFKHLLRLKGEPKYVAKGFALGSFIGMMPIPGFQMLVSLAIASMIKVHKTAAIIGVFNTNVVTGAFVFAFNYWLGKTILGISPNFVFPETIGLNFITSILAAGSNVYSSLLLGGLVTGVLSWFVSYHLVFNILKSRQSNE